MFPLALVRNRVQIIIKALTELNFHIRRVVPEKMRSFALGVQWLFIRALGSIPGPIMFGAIIDKSCILWQEKRCTGERGNCWVYSSSDLALYVIIVSKWTFLVGYDGYRYRYNIMKLSQRTQTHKL